MSAACTKERFLRDVATHVMNVIREDGVNRHVRFKQPDSTNMYFDLITWPGFLCYSGDMGTFVFQRTNDMFAFFRKDGLLDTVDHAYWAEKIEASDRDGVRKFSHAMFQAMVRSWVDESEKNDRPCTDDAEAMTKFTAAYAELRTVVESEVVNTDDNSVRCFDSANDFRHNGDDWQEFHGENAQFEFNDVWDGFDLATQEYTFRFLWCCYALVWGIQQYDAAKASAKLDESVTT
ncbi:hypothetical protein [Undibacterium sp. TJN19]|uniref:hypothetical protein n=1 Tax=Undibacterium sp. TJN19 TaxID=3413055 RepID=UPI003BF31878